MPVFCAKCGAELTPGNQFCAACGAPAAVQPAVTAPVYQASIPPAIAPPNSGNSTLKIVLIVVAVFVGLGILGAGAFGFFVWRIAHSVHVSGPNGQVTMNTPGGAITTNPTETFSASDLGTDIYPGAQQSKGGMRMTLGNSSVVTAVFVTPDSKEQVVNFYKNKLGSNANVFDYGTGASASINKSDKESILITITSNPNLHDGKTQFSIVHSVKN